MSAELTLTPAAQQHIQALIAEETKHPKLRVYVTGGGCSGLQYGFNFVTEVTEDDTLVQISSPEEHPSIQVLLDPLSYPYLLGAEVDYQSGLYGARFVVTNPNAKSTCGCGSSFVPEQYID